MAEVMELYQTAIYLPMWLDLACSATCKKKKKKCIRQGRRALCVLQDGKAEENWLVLAGPGPPLSKRWGSVRH